jgi:hypothetical protein
VCVSLALGPTIHARGTVPAEKRGRRARACANMAPCWFWKRRRSHVGEAVLVESRWNRLAGSRGPLMGMPDRIFAKTRPSPVAFVLPYPNQWQGFAASPAKVQRECASAGGSWPLTWDVSNMPVRRRSQKEHPPWISIYGGLQTWIRQRAPSWATCRDVALASVVRRA